eukprot:2973365-Pyramimonas_sp.AAC.1
MCAVFFPPIPLLPVLFLPASFPVDLYSGQNFGHVHRTTLPPMPAFRHCYPSLGPLSSCAFCTPWSPSLGRAEGSLREGQRIHSPPSPASLRKNASSNACTRPVQLLQRLATIARGADARSPFGVTRALLLRKPVAFKRRCCLRRAGQGARSAQEKGERIGEDIEDCI